MSKEILSEIALTKVNINQELKTLRNKFNFPIELYDGAFHLPLAGGKRLRPLMVIKTCEMLNGNVKKATVMATSLELLHNFTLIHDDIIDEDEFRRGTPTTHIKWGVPVAISAGDAVFSLVFNHLVNELENYETKPKIINNAVKTLSKSALIVCEGLVQDVSPEKYVNSVNDYLDMITRKTAELFDTSCYLGGLSAEANDIQLFELSKYGQNIGKLFQIVDDLLGIIGDPSVTGKPVGGDLKMGRRTIIIIHSLLNSSTNNKEKLEALLQKKNISQTDIDNALAIINKTQSIDYAKKLANHFMNEAIGSLSIFENNKHKKFLQLFPQFLYSRDK